jgi:hypothetical protein
MCSFVWYMMIRNAENEAEIAAFKARLWRPDDPEAQIPPESPWSAENEMASFAALAAETGQATRK